MMPDREFERAGYDAEIKLLENVSPHWPTYRRVMRLCERVAEAIDAARGRDVGDYLANRAATTELPALLDELGCDTESLAGGIWDTITRTKRISEKQMKALAMSAAKAATLAGRK